jgi:hypothetical protein
MGTALVAALAACGSSNSEGPSKDYGRRPDWNVTLPGGRKVSASDYDEKVVVVCF